MQTRYKPVSVEDASKPFKHRYVYKFDNGYGASVVSLVIDNHTIYELAVLGQDGSIIYSTPITNDVIGNLKEDEVLDILNKIADLKQPKTQTMEVRKKVRFWDIHVFYDLKNDFLHGIVFGKVSNFWKPHYGFWIREEEEELLFDNNGEDKVPKDVQKEIIRLAKKLKKEAF